MQNKNTVFNILPVIQKQSVVCVATLHLYRIAALSLKSTHSVRLSFTEAPIKGFQMDLRTAQKTIIWMHIMYIY